MTDILCVNETEAMIFAGYENASDTFDSDKEIEAVMEILLKKCPTVIITLGKKGAAYAHREVLNTFSNQFKSKSIIQSKSFRKVDAPVLDKGKLI